MVSSITLKGAKISSRFNSAVSNRYNGAFTSESNARFDVWLKSRDPASGVRDFEAVDALARAQGLSLQQDIAMPANNRSLIWKRLVSRTKCRI